MKNNRHFHLAGWFGATDVPPEPFPPGNQDITEEDHPSATDPYDVVKAAVFSDPYYGNAWCGPERMVLPVYKQTLGSLLRGSSPREAPLSSSGQANGSVARRFALGTGS
jgi:hypothetical protein